MEAATLALEPSYRRGRVKTALKRATVEAIRQWRARTESRLGCEFERLAAIG